MITVNSQLLRASKLNELKTSAKTLVNTKKFYNRKKMTIIPPLIVNNELVSVFKATSNLFNNYFVLQCTPSEKKTIVCLFHTAITQSCLE